MPQYKVYDKIKQRWAGDTELEQSQVFRSLIGAQEWKLDLGRRLEKAANCKFTDAYDAFETITVDSNGRRVK